MAASLLTFRQPFSRQCFWQRLPRRRHYRESFVSCLLSVAPPLSQVPTRPLPPSTSKDEVKDGSLRAV